MERVSTITKNLVNFDYIYLDREKDFRVNQKWFFLVLFTMH